MLRGLNSHSFWKGPAQSLRHMHLIFYSALYAIERELPSHMDNLYPPPFKLDGLLAHPLTMGFIGDLTYVLIRVRQGNKMN